MQILKQGLDRSVVIPIIWIVIVLNYAYADILILLSGHGPSTPEEAELVKQLSTPNFFMLSAVYLEIAMVMAVLSRVLKYTINRWANIIFAGLQAVGAFAALFVATPANFYIFFSAVEISALLFIVWYAWTWAEPTVAENE